MLMFPLYTTVTFRCIPYVHDREVAEDRQKLVRVTKECLEKASRPHNLSVFSRRRRCYSRTCWCEVTGTLVVREFWTRGRLEIPRDSGSRTRGRRGTECCSFQAWFPRSNRWLTWENGIYLIDEDNDWTGYYRRWTTFRSNGKHHINHGNREQRITW